MVSKVTRLVLTAGYLWVLGGVEPALAQTASAKPAPVSAKLPAADAFKSVKLAAAHCPGDTVVWSTLSKSKSYHLAASRYYGKTKHGAYVCEKDATAAGFHASKE
jgi:hypothetical protein